jgi:hypothetical protein
MKIGHIALAALAVSLSALAADPFVGKWKLMKSTQKDARIGAVSAFGEIPGSIRLTMPGGSRPPLDLVVG